MTSQIVTPVANAPYFLDYAIQLMEKQRRLNAQQLAELLHISDSLATVLDRQNKKWELPNRLSESTKPCITVFTGSVYRSLHVLDWTDEDFLYANKHVYILSGMYGVLRPLDLIYPYRLDMGTRWQLDEKTKNLYAFWNTQLSDFVNTDLLISEQIINLASAEYFKVLLPERIKGGIITPIFKEKTTKGYRIIGTYAKVARGKMARFIVKNQIDNPEMLFNYTEDNYHFNQQLSSTKEWVFTRE